jgi:S-adenosylmethionine-diacylglycerol 3-amino-3-carboxypropyl transferase
MALTEVPTPALQLRDAVRGNAATAPIALLERLFARLFQDLVYPQIWEDPVADMAALALAPSDRVICIASGGCNMMSYLTAGPASVTAVDLSPAHVALGRLKIAAARHLPDHAAFHGFFASADLSYNTALYDRYLAPVLDPETRAYWETRTLRGRRINMFTRGFHRHGLLGRFIGATHLVARLGGVDFRPLLGARTLSDQRRFFEAEIDPLLASPIVRFLARRRAALFGLGIPPAQYDKLAADAGGDVLPVLRERARRLICDFPIRENYFAWQALARRYDTAPDASLPPYLMPAHFDAVRENAGRARVFNRSLTDLLEGEPAGRHDAYVLLDAQDWMSDAQLDALWLQITRAAAPGARVLFRTGGTPDILPGRLAPELLARWSCDRAASEAATAADRSAIYGATHLYRRAA